MQTPPDLQRSAWIAEVVTEIEAAELFFKEPQWLRGDWPEWVQLLSKALLKTIIPGVKQKPVSQWTAGEAGALVGTKHVCAYWLFEGEAYSISAFREVMSMGSDFPRDHPLRGVMAEGIMFWKKMWRDAAPRLQLAIERSLTLAARAPHHENVRFFKAYTKAVQRIPSQTGDLPGSTTSTGIYFFTFVFWRYVQTLSSCRVFHELLCKVFGPQMVGDQKRIEKMCERLGLKFAQPFAALPATSATDKSV
ncbi:MAG: hypothetical protein QM796_02475 [Chthoniobacteraceae bacterium]